MNTRVNVLLEKDLKSDDEGLLGMCMIMEDIYEHVCVFYKL